MAQRQLINFMIIFLASRVAKHHMGSQSKIRRASCCSNSTPGRGSIAALGPIHPPWKVIKLFKQGRSYFSFSYKLLSVTSSDFGARLHDTLHGTSTLPLMVSSVYPGFNLCTIHVPHCCRLVDQLPVLQQLEVKYGWVYITYLNASDSSHLRTRNPTLSVLSYFAVFAPWHSV